jgi:hypothetical protein
VSESFADTLAGLIAQRFEIEEAYARADDEALAEMRFSHAAIRQIRGDMHGPLDDNCAEYPQAILHSTQVALLVQRRRRRPSG